MEGYYYSDILFVVLFVVLLLKLVLLLLYYYLYYDDYSRLATSTLITPTPTLLFTPTGHYVAWSARALA